MPENPLGLDPLSPEAAAVRELAEEHATQVQADIDARRAMGDTSTPLMITVDLAIATVRRAVLGDLMAEGERWRYEQAFERAERFLLALEGRVPGPTGPTPSLAEPEAVGDSGGQPMAQNYPDTAARMLTAVGWGEDPEHVLHLATLLRAQRLYIERDSGQRRGVWRRSGVKGQVMHAYAKAERAFMALFKFDEVPDEDHLLDQINYAAFALRLQDEAIGRWQADIQAVNKSLNGEWPWS